MVELESADKDFKRWQLDDGGTPMPINEPVECIFQALHRVQMRMSSGIGDQPIAARGNRQGT